MLAALLFILVVTYPMPVWIQRDVAKEGCWLTVTKARMT